MKLRAQRVHHMGASNRDLESLANTTKNVFESSHIKSQSQYYKTAHSLPPEDEKQGIRKNPFQGTHFQQESLRWNSKAKRNGTDTEWKLQPVVQPLDYSGMLNQQVADLTTEFEGKDVNMFKLKELKRTFVKNNRKRRSLEDYFHTFAKEGKVGVEGMKDIVREYGYDITEDEAKLIFRLTGSHQDSLKIDQFVELMTKDNVHFRTLKLNGAYGKARSHFDQSTHLVLRNKFYQLKQAFRIYRMRGESVDQHKFDYVMKKLDINDLVISKEHRKQIFQKFNDNRTGFNVERLLCSIIEQEGMRNPTFPPKLSEYEDNLRAKEEESARNSKRDVAFDFKRLSHLQYEHQLQRAQEVQRELRKYPQASELVAKRGGILSRKEVRKEIQTFLQTRGINFVKEDYDCFISYLDFNSNNQISNKDFQSFLVETSKKAEERFERRIRALPPQGNAKPTDFDEATAIDSLGKVKAKQLDTQMRVLFKQFDKDKDGFVSRAELKNKIEDLAVLENWQVQNLANYFDPEGNGFVTFKDFASKYTNGDREPENLTEHTVKAKSQSEWISTKRSFIKDTNAYIYNVPTKYSAWPERLKRTDFSMIQPPNKAGQFISEDNRFNVSEKHSFAQQMKQEKNRVYQNRLRKLVAWNELNQQRINNTEIKEQKRSQANDYLLRATKESYEQQCHNK